MKKPTPVRGRNAAPSKPIPKSAKKPVAKQPELPKPKLRSRLGAYYFQSCLVQGWREYADLKPYPLLQSVTPQGVLDWCEGLRDLAKEGGIHANVYVTVDSLILTVRKGSGFGIEEQDHRRVIELIHLLYHEEMEWERYQQQEWSKKHPRKKYVVISDSEQKANIDFFKKAEVAIVAVDEPMGKDHPAPKQTIQIKPVAGAKISCGIPVLEDGKRIKIFNLPLTYTMRWMGAANWEEDQAKAAFQKLSIPNISDSTLRVQMRSGFMGEQGSHGPPPKFSPEQEKLLNALLPAKKPIKKGK